MTLAESTVARQAHEAAVAWAVRTAPAGTLAPHERPVSAPRAQGLSWPAGTWRRRLPWLRPHSRPPPAHLCAARAGCGRIRDRGLVDEDSRPQATVAQVLRASRQPETTPARLSCLPEEEAAGQSISVTAVGPAANGPTPTGSSSLPLREAARELHTRTAGRAAAEVGTGTATGATTVLSCRRSGGAEGPEGWGGHLDQALAGRAVRRGRWPGHRVGTWGSPSSSGPAGCGSGLLSRWGQGQGGQPSSPGQAGPHGVSRWGLEWTVVGRGHPGGSVLCGWPLERPWPVSHKAPTGHTCALPPP